MSAAALGSFARNPIETLISGLVGGIIQKANAASLPSNVIKPRNYIVLYIEGGPARWTFDGVLNPYGTPKSLPPDPSVVTRFRNTGGPNAGSPEYGTLPITRQGVTLNMPHLWGCQIPTVAGGMVPMANLLDNMAIIRGIDMIVDGHAENARKQIRPLFSSPSLDGLVADASNLPIPSVATGYYGLVLADAYKSAKGNGIIGLDPGHVISAGRDPLLQFLTPFDRSADGLLSSYLSRRTAFESVMSQALASLGSYAGSNNPGAENLYLVRSTAESMLKKGIGNISGVFNGLATKYQRLISDVQRTPIPGVTDKPVLFSNLPAANDKGVTVQTSIQDDGVTYSVGNSDLTTVIGANANPRHMAYNFAIAEYLITNGYSSTVQCGFHAVEGIYGQDRLKTTDGSNLGSGTGSWLFDEHYGGSYASLLINSFNYRCLSACLYELISVLKAKNLFSETVIHITSEFNRIPRQEGGTDHAPEATVNTIISGAIDKPYVLGNILNRTDRGCYGVAAPVKVDGASVNLGVGHSTSTIAALLRVASPSKNNSSLLLEKSGGGGVTPTIELAVNKEPGDP